MWRHYKWYYERKEASFTAWGISKFKNQPKRTLHFSQQWHVQTSIVSHTIWYIYGVFWFCIAKRYCMRNIMWVMCNDTFVILLIFYSYVCIFLYLIFLFDHMLWSPVACLLNQFKLIYPYYILVFWPFQKKGILTLKASVTTITLTLPLRVTLIFFFVSYDFRDS